MTDWKSKETKMDPDEEIEGFRVVVESLGKMEHLHLLFLDLN
jgi:hypothetical protein